MNALFENNPYFFALLEGLVQVNQRAKQKGIRKQKDIDKFMRQRNNDKEWQDYIKKRGDIIKDEMEAETKICQMKPI